MIVFGMILLAKGKLLREVLADVSIKVLFLDIVFIIEEVSSAFKKLTDVTFVDAIALLQKPAVKDAQINFRFFHLLQLLLFQLELFLFQRNVFLELFKNGLLLPDILCLFGDFLFLTLDLSV